MPIETQKEKEKFGNPLEDMPGKRFSITLDRKSEGKNIELHFKGPGSRDELEKALAEGKLPSGWEATVSYGKKGKAYTIDESTLFDNYLKGTGFEKTTPGAIKSSLSGADKTVAGARAVSFSTAREKPDSGAKTIGSASYRDSSSSGASQSEFTVSKPDSSSSGASRIGYSESRDSPTSGASNIGYAKSRDKPSSGATVIPFSKSRDSTSSGAGKVAGSVSNPDKSFSGAREVDAKLMKGARKQEIAYSEARGKTSSGGTAADFELSRDQPKKGRARNAAEEKPGDVAESD